MPRVVNIQIELSDADCAAYEGIPATPGTDRQTFLIAKLAAQFAPALSASLANSNVLDLLSEADQMALGGLIAAVKALPAGGGQ